ncbi:hypothetical protein ACTXJ2_06700 [Psychrobacter alimentarius]|uniref:hypothetical protein n=1 Tax=Psychrobacter alimentarius TaxID=261164 RepID=UPI003FBA4524
MSILIDELEARKNDYILVADVIELMARATNSTPSQVVDYLDAHKIDEHLIMFYMDNSYNFYQYHSFLVGLGNDAKTTYFKIEDIMAFEPITKHGVFKENQDTNSVTRDVYGRTYDINQHKKNREDDYLTLSETIDLININLDSEYGLSIDNTKLRDLVRKKKFTPCFYYHGYVGEMDYHGVLYTEIIAAYFTYRLLTEEICGYDSHMELPSDGVTIYRVIERKTAKFADFDDGLFLFYKNPNGFNNIEEARLTHVEDDEIRFSKREVDSYIASLSNNNPIKDATPAQNNGELLAKLEKLQVENDDLNSRLSTARNTYKQHRNEIKELTEKNEKAEFEKAELIEQLQSQETSQADDVQLNGIAKYNADKSFVISTSQAFASYIWSMDTEKAIRTGDMVQQIRHVMHNVAPKLLPDDKAIREWLSGIAPDYAKKAGKTPKDAPSEISLIMKK